MHEEPDRRYRQTAPIAYPVRQRQRTYNASLRLLNGIEHFAVRSVANSVDEDADAASISTSDGAIQLLNRECRQASMITAFKWGQHIGGF